jgi:CBS domain-containing protein
MDAAPTLVREVMTRRAEVVSPDDTLQAAAHLMRVLNVGFLVVREAAGEALGVITDRDITVRATAEGREPHGTYVRDAMTPQLFACYEDEEIWVAARHMAQTAVRRLVVFDRDRRVVGVLSVDDVARVLGAEQLAGDVLRHAAEPIT